MESNKVIREIDAEIECLQRVQELLSNQAGTKPKVAKKRRRLSPEGRARNVAAVKNAPGTMASASTNAIEAGANRRYLVFMSFFSSAGEFGPADSVANRELTDICNVEKVKSEVKFR